MALAKQKLLKKILISTNVQLPNIEYAAMAIGHI